VTDLDGDLDDQAPESNGGADADRDHGELRDGIKVLRERAKRTVALEAENHELRVSAAVRDLHLTDTQRAAVLHLHGDGEVSEDAYRQTAESLSFLAPVSPNVVGFDEQAAHQRMADATAAAMPSEAFQRTLNDDLNGAQSTAELEAILARQGMLSRDY
jgi:hypothetical protein